MTNDEYLNAAESSNKPPRGANVDEWHLFLCALLDNRANHPNHHNELRYAAVKIAEAIDIARRPNNELIEVAWDVVRLSGGQRRLKNRE